MKVKASAPGKLLLFGDHAVIYGQPCLVTAVNQRLTVEATKADSNQILLPQELKSSQFLSEVLTQFQQDFKINGVRIKTNNGLSNQYGFGSSAAATVAATKAISQLFKLNLTKKEIFDFSYRVVIKIQGVGSGFDVAAAVYGGVLYFIKAGKVIEPLPVKKLPLVVGYSGVKADTVTLVKKVAKLRKNKPKKVASWFKASGQIVEKAKEALISKDWQQAGELMQQNQAILKKLSVSTPKLDKLIEAALSAGAYGAKLSGAGGGDCMIALVNDQTRRKVKRAIELAGGKVIKTTI